MSSKNRKLQITVTTVTRRPKRDKIDLQIDQFKRRLENLIGDPAVKYLANPQVFTARIADALQQVNLGLVIN